MNDPIKSVTWVKKSKELDSLLEHSSLLTIVPLDSGLEAEVIRICMAESSYVLKLWNRNSKPDVKRQFKLLEALHNRGLSVSQPLGWGLDSNKNQVLLTHFDGVPIGKVNKSILTELAKILTNIHRFPTGDLDTSVLQKYDFISYFYPAIEDHLDIKNLLTKLLESTFMKQECIIHGDYNLGNILEAEGKFTIIDWTNGQLGDPRYDIAWSIVLMRIYVGERYGSVYLSAYLKQNQYSIIELELFEAIACLRWILLNRIAILPKGSDTIIRVKSILKNNKHLNGNLL
jgi:aminoglycoside phosphotransferase (APT) family kinase protein